MAGMVWAVTMSAGEYEDYRKWYELFETEEGAQKWMGEEIRRQKENHLFLEQKYKMLQGVYEEFENIHPQPKVPEKPKFDHSRSKENGYQRIHQIALEEWRRDHNIFMNEEFHRLESRNEFIDAEIRKRLIQPTEEEIENKKIDVDFAIGPVEVRD